MKRMLVMILDPTFDLKYKSRQTTDSVKVAYNLLAIVHKVASTFFYADVTLFKKK
ncbi:hypothetical protein BD770DRAFT_389235 [Pilaira anomala]|nr:hypothetical protein BD770DRAFT_389235 [Pilaira anomala]